MGSVEDAGIWRRDQTAYWGWKVLRYASSVLLSSNFLWATHGTKLYSHMISFNLYNLERKSLHYHHHTFHRWEN